LLGGYGGYGYGNYGYGGSYTYQPDVYTTYSPTIIDQTVIDPNSVDPNSTPLDAASMPLPDEQSAADSIDFAGQGENDFKAGDYNAAAREWRHALVDDPNNGPVVLLLGQSLFQLGQFDEAAGATQHGLAMLPPEQWGGVVKNYTQLYGNIQQYTDRLKDLEKARDAKPDSPGLRFLLGYHFGYLGYPKQAVRELNKALELQPKDKLAQTLLDQMTGQLNGEAPQVKPDRSEVTPAAPPILAAESET